ncbi:MAG TPA: integrase DNA-binding domain-containing protein, partial [Methanocorpusculum sp.]|nr:integrase DNA-binding domain-containing protein [Methanocorpusculum sp.]
YVYQYTDLNGKRCNVYSSRLEKTDRYPDGATKKEPSLREKEKEIQDRLDHGLNDFGSELTVIELAERYIATRTGVRESTKTGYRTTLNIIRKDPFGHMRIDKVKLSDAKLWLIKLQQQDGRRYSSIHNVRGSPSPGVSDGSGR